MRYLPALAFFLIGAIPALAESCPPGAPSCKIVILTPDEEKVLLGPNGIFDTAAQARALDLANLVIYFRNKIATAPAGTQVQSAPAGTVTPPATPESVPLPTPDPRK